jgi:hypothetical protein
VKLKKEVSRKFWYRGKAGELEARSARIVEINSVIPMEISDLKKVFTTLLIMPKF